MRDHLVLGFIWIAAIVLANPFGDFPLNDDWVYGRTVKTLLEEGVLRIPDFVAAPVVSQVAWGALFCLFVGEHSFTALRLSTLALAILGTAMTYELLRRHLAPRWALMGALLMLANPIYMGLSFTFMTDVPFYAFSAVSLYFFFRVTDKPASADLAIAVLFLILAVLCRQIGIFIPMAFSVAFVLRHGFSRKNLLMAALPLALTVGGLKLFEYILMTTTGLPELYSSKQQAMWGVFKNGRWMSFLFQPGEGSFARRVFPAMLYSGLFLFPVLLPMALFQAGRLGQRTRLASAVAVAAIAGLLLSHWRMMPIGCNILCPSGIGPQALKDSQVPVFKLTLEQLDPSLDPLPIKDALRDGFPTLPLIPPVFWIMMTSISVIGLVLLVYLLALTLRNLWKEGIRKRPHVILGLLAVLFYLVPICLVGYFDRYLLILFPLLLLVSAPGAGSEAGPESSAVSTRIGMGLVVAAGLLSLAATHDYLSWNRVRWETLERLNKAGVLSPETTDGGMEYNGWHLYKDNNYRPEAGKSWWWVRDDSYVVSFRNLKGYEVHEIIPYPRWLPPGNGRLLILRRRAVL